MVACSAPSYENTPLFTATLDTPTSTPLGWLEEARSLVEDEATEDVGGGGEKKSEQPRKGLDRRVLTKPAEQATNAISQRIVKKNLNDYFKIQILHSVALIHRCVQQALCRW